MLLPFPSTSHLPSHAGKKDFFSTYLNYTSDSEVPVSFHRWSAVAGIGAILERNIYVELGNSHIYPNEFSMLIGTAATRKSSAIKLMKRLLRESGYDTIAAEKTSKEKFLLDLAGESDAGSDNILERNIFGSDDNSSDLRTMAIFPDEANDFFGISNMEFLSMLGSMWDWHGPPYSNRIKTGVSVCIPNPTISILSGNTPTGFAAAFPPEIIGQGFFSRLLLIYGESNGRKIAFPKVPHPAETLEVTNFLKEIKSYYYGKMEYVGDAKSLLTKIYEQAEPMEDARFDSYSGRRFTHLLKLCLVVAASKLETGITSDTVIQANTYLSYAESLMPKALGEFGKSRNSDVTHKVLSFIEHGNNGCGVKLQDIMKTVSADLDKPADMGDIIRKLSVAEKIQSVGGYFLPMKKKALSDKAGMIDTRYLTEEELSVKG